MEELKKIFPFKHRGICDDFVDAKRAGVKFDKSIFENFEYTPIQVISAKVQYIN
jgi:hypothetical protein